MKKIIAIFGSFCFLLLVSGCATQGTLPTPTNYNKTRTYDVPFDSVWNAIIGGIAEANLNISTLEKASGIIAISDTTYPPSYAEEGTRGSKMGVPDQVLQRVAKLNIFATRISDNKTTVRVNTSFHMQIRSGNGSEIFPYQYTWVEAYSNGKIERKILDSIATRTSSNQASK